MKLTYEASMLQIFQVLDFMVLQGITAASVSANFHSMCNAMSRVDPVDRPAIEDQDVSEVWFTGCHSDVGAGDVALRWDARRGDERLVPP